MTPHLSKVDDALDPGLTFLSWTSINIDQFIDNAHKALGRNVKNNLKRLKHPQINSELLCSKAVEVFFIAFAYYELRMSLNCLFLFVFYGLLLL